MRRTVASYYSGSSSRRHSVDVELDDVGERLHLSEGNWRKSYPLTALRITPRVANTPWNVYLPDDGLCTFSEHDFVEALLSTRQDGGWHRLVHRLESRWRYVAAALGVSVLLIWGFVAFGIPELARQVAYALPLAVDTEIGEKGLDTLDELFFTDTELPAGRSTELRNRFRSVTAWADSGHRYRLEFRKGGKVVGANALALPSGIVVITDELLELAENDQEVIAILAHEVGHVVYRHSLRLILQDSAAALVLAAVLGDIASLSSLAVTLPAVMLQTSYSRQFEIEADDYALRYLKENGIATHHFADILTRLEKTARGGGGGRYDFLSTHPATTRRVRKFIEE